MGFLTDAERFLNQNERAAETLREHEEELENFAEHHAGGLFVLMWEGGDEGKCMKLHDSWGDDEFVVVHIYDPEDADAEDTCLYFPTGIAAWTHFLSIVSATTTD